MGRGGIEGYVWCVYVCARACVHTCVHAGPVFCDIEGKIFLRMSRVGGLVVGLRKEVDFWKSRCVDGGEYTVCTLWPNIRMA